MKETIRIIWAITSKDIVDGFKNKLVLGIIIPAIFVVGIYRLLPGLESGEGPPNVLVYDAGESSLVAVLEDSLEVRLYTYPSQEEMEIRLAHGDVPELGLVIPADFDRVLEAGGEPELEGYVLHWVSKEDANELRWYLEALVTELIDAPVRIRMEGNIVDTRPDSRGIGLVTGMGFVFVIIMIGVALPANMLIEEKTTRTLEALMVSPATNFQVVISKALTSVFYCMGVLAFGFLLSRTLILQWGLAFWTGVFSSLVGIGIGLFLGAVLEVRQQLMIWSWVAIFPLFVPVMLSIMDDLIPASVIAVFQWFPTVSMFKLFRVSFSTDTSLALIGPEFARLTVYVLLLCLLVGWAVRRTDNR
jgi:ABC-2 type transport system permease protein